MKSASNNNLQFVYFGGEPIGRQVLQELLACGLTPALVVCNPDRPAGRGQQLTPPPVKVLAQEQHIPVIQPENIPKNKPLPRKGLGKDDVYSELTDLNAELFVVVAYNRILPEWLIELPKYQTINLHPSLLPLRRGPNPIRSAILEDDRNSIGVSIMLLDTEMDHGPILAQRALPIADELWPSTGPELDMALANLGGACLADVIPKWVAGEITPVAQNHGQATYTSKISRADAELSIKPLDLPRGADAQKTLRTIRAYAGWPGAFFMHEGKRIKINDAKMVGDQLHLVSITPEGKSPMPFDQWLPKSNR